MFDAREIANFILDQCDKRGLAISNMSINKIVYFAHGWHLALKKSALISNRIEAWEHGPVIRALYREFQRFGDSPITDRAQRFDFALERHVLASVHFDEETERFLEWIVDSYGRRSAFELRAMTHEPSTPWSTVWYSEKAVNVGMIIPDSLIQDYFSRKRRH